MTSAPHLLTEDRPDFEHVLDEALRIVLDETTEGDGHRGDPTVDPETPLNAEQLRTMALAAAESIIVSVAEEYDAYREIRTETRRAAREDARQREGRAFGYAAMGMADRSGRGAGLFAVLAVLTPLLAGAAAVIFLLIGYALRAVSPEPAIAAPLRTAGWFFAVVTGAAVVLGGIGLLLTALRDGSGAIHDAPESLPPQVADARAEWQRALRDRGLVPFLEDALSHAPPGPSGTTTRITRMPHLGYTRPDFSSPQSPRDDRPEYRRE